MSIYLARQGQDNIPVSVQLNRFGHRGYMTFQNPDHGIYVSFVANIATLINELRSTANILQSLIVTPHEQISINDLSDDLPDEQKIALLIKRFEHTLPQIAEILRQELNGTIPDYTADLAKVRHLIRHDESGKLARGVRAQIARELGIKDGGHGHKRISRLIQEAA